MSKHIGKRIKTLRIEKGLTLPGLAEKAGISKGSLSQLENEEESNPSLDTLNKLAKALETTLATLLERESVRAKRIVPVPEELDPALQSFIEETNDRGEKLDDNILQALYVIQQRKGQPVKTKENWRWLYESIRRGIQQK